MGQVIALDSYREPNFPERRQAANERPVFQAEDVWGRDYTQKEAILYGVFKVRETLLYYTPYHDDMDRLLLDALEAAYKVAEFGQNHLCEMIGPVKEYVLRYMDEANVKHMKTALILLDLIEKSPRYK